jgi:tetratricopeptide (TPR) repeat protein
MHDERDASESSLQVSLTDRLDSWKAIAAHFGRDVRTVQRWEREEGLPVHRHVHRKRGTVHAFTQELDTWWRGRASEVPPHREEEPLESAGPRLRLLFVVVLLILTAAGLLALRSSRSAPRGHSAETTVRELLDRGRHHSDQFTPDGMRRAIEAYAAAAARAPDLAEAHAGLAVTHMWAIARSPEPPREHYEIARRAAAQAMALDPHIPASHAASARVHEFRREWRAAAAGYARALAIEPSDAWIRAWYALVLARKGDVDRALVEIRRARGLQPLSLPIQAQEGWILFWAGRVHEAMVQWQRTLEVDPNFPLAHYNLGLGYTRLGVHDQAVARFSRALELVPGRVAYRAQLGGAYARSGHETQARELLRQLLQQTRDEYVSGFHLATLYTALRDSASALRELERAEHEGEPALSNLPLEPFWFESLAHDTRYQSLLARIQHPAPSDVRP